eukprot:CAMPEP_0170575556 /NCGR_PEP_ID=MMETSP0224-20130122/3925_1 /TAXON_ID=285029 /ORGANISM="Togula jolla, Strain CCCM 725" /LENGTH=115 /DNA_ID=CAMNT_0010898345 /DNA_START=61 /DNA_END=408 /DNA_ORIENTATION=+
MLLLNEVVDLSLDILNAVVASLLLGAVDEPLCEGAQRPGALQEIPLTLRHSGHSGRSGRSSQRPGGLAAVRYGMLAKANARRRQAAWTWHHCRSRGQLRQPRRTAFASAPRRTVL